MGGTSSFGLSCISSDGKCPVTVFSVFLWLPSSIFFTYIKRGKAKPPPYPKYFYILSVQIDAHHMRNTKCFVKLLNKPLNKKPNCQILTIPSAFGNPAIFFNFIRSVALCLRLTADLPFRSLYFYPVSVQSITYKNRRCQVEIYIKRERFLSFV